MDNILVVGANGQLGSEIKEIALNYKNFNFFFTDLKKLNITDHNAVNEFVKINRINVIINCAAYTSVDKAESEPMLANLVNHLAVANFAQIVKEKNIKLVHISTDYVFDGTNYKPYTEVDIPNPLSVYGQTKLNGELAIKKINPPNSIIIRTSWVYSKFGNNFVKTMLSLAKSKEQISVVSDQVGSPTNAADLAQVVLTIVPLIKNKGVEVLHFSNEGVCSWYDFAKAIFKLKALKIKVNPINSKQYSTSAIRPYYSVLDKTLIKKKYRLNGIHWLDSLKKYLL